ncbi:MAG: hypothetical protein HGA54_00910 [Actinobacteria bacterium]|nr:hypothetical protein [Actinomycetota bacterium]
MNFRSDDMQSAGLSMVFPRLKPTRDRQCFATREIKRGAKKKLPIKDMRPVEEQA